MTTHIADFDTLLNGSGTLGVAVSGGGDSVALLQALTEWGQRPLHVFCVDHGINAQSANWTQSVAEHAERLSLPFTGLTWTGDKPQTGLSAAARTARHALLADAARTEGIRVLCLAHTADDIAEAGLMRAQGSNVGAPRIWSPSPAWPQGRGVFLCRPLLNVRRIALRNYLRVRGIGWIEDPANENPQSLRARARKALDGAATDVEPVADRLSRGQIEALLYDPEGWSDLGLLRFQADGIRQLPDDTAIRLLGAAAVCAGGGNKLPRRDRVAGLLGRLADGGPHTLCGARIQQTDGLIHVMREAGDVTRHGTSEVMTKPGYGGVWDGRFEVRAAEPLRITASGGLRSQLSETDRARLAWLPAGLRAVLPVINALEGPLLAHSAHGALRQGLYDTLEVTGWVRPRFLAAVCELRVGTDL